MFYFKHYFCIFVYFYFYIFYILTQTRKVLMMDHVWFICNLLLSVTGSHTLLCNVGFVL